jgi:hypothetical protein
MASQTESAGATPPVKDEFVSGRQIIGRAKQVGDRSIGTHLHDLTKDPQIAVDGYFS